MADFLDKLEMPEPRSLLASAWMSRISMFVMLMLCVTGVWGFQKTLEIRTRATALSNHLKSHREFSETRIELYEVALNAKPDQSFIEKTNTALRAHQAVKGALQIVDSTKVQIVTVPDIETIERRTFTWRVFVPEGQSVRAVAKLCVNRESFESARTLFARDLPPGESLVQMIWVDAWEPRLKSRGVLEVPKDAGLRFRVASEEFPVQERSMKYSRGANGIDFEHASALFADSTNTMLGYVDGEYDISQTIGETVQFWLQEVHK